MRKNKKLNANIVKIKLNQWWSTISPISTKRTITSHLSLLNTNKITIYDVGNPGPGLEQAQTGCGVKPVYGIPTSDFHSKHHHKNEWQHNHGKYNIRVNECSNLWTNKS